MGKSVARSPTIIGFLRHCYESESRFGQQFRYWLLAFDVLTILFIVFTSFAARTTLVFVLDIVIGIVILADVAARFAISRTRARDLLQLATWADFAALVSFLGPLAGEPAGFLRVLRTTRLLRTYPVLSRLRKDSAWFRQREKVILAVVHMWVFLFIVTSIVYETQHFANPHIANYADALYFTVATLTTTGFGDITLTGTGGRLLSVIVMMSGVTIFLNLVRALLGPSKIRIRCPRCGLSRHDADAAHCKACGIALDFREEENSR